MSWLLGEWAAGTDWEGMISYPMWITRFGHPLVEQHMAALIEEEGHGLDWMVSLVFGFLGALNLLEGG